MKSSPNAKKNYEKQNRLTPEASENLENIEQTAIARFMGDLSELESALGMLRLGQQYGWRVMYLIHSKATIRKYEEILGVSIKDAMPEVGPSSDRCRGYRVSQKLGGFWKIVSGETKVPDKRQTE